MADNSLMGDVLGPLPHQGSGRLECPALGFYTFSHKGWEQWVRHQEIRQRLQRGLGVFRVWDVSLRQGSNPPPPGVLRGLSMESLLR